MKNKACFCIFVFAALLYAAFAAAPLAAQYQGFSLGLGVEGNGITVIDGLGLGGQFSAEARFSERFSLDFHAGISTLISEGAVYSFLAMEALLYPRWYFLTLDDPSATGFELFAGVGAGVLTTVSNTDFRESRGSPEIGVIGGARFRLRWNFYVEPYIRAGYPTLFSLGVMAGLRFPAEPLRERVIETKVEKLVETKTETVYVEKPSAPGAAADIVLSVYFPPDLASFEGLDGATAARNEKALDEIVRLLKENPSAQLLLEGHANPAYGSEADHLLLGGRRAAYVEEALLARGLSQGRMVIADWGGRNLAVPLEDWEHWSENRRVDMRMLF
jgi:outer membrane protein OmpA-like peptidoglycan-associated protein